MFASSGDDCSTTMQHMSNVLVGALGCSQQATVGKLLAACYLDPRRVACYYLLVALLPVSKEGLSARSRCVQRVLNGSGGVGMVWVETAMRRLAS